MKRWFVLPVLAVFAASLFGSVVAAQEVPEKPWALKVGIFRPDDGDWRDVSRSTWFAAGLDYTAQITPSGAEWVGTLEYLTGKNSNRMWTVQAIYKMRSYAEAEEGSRFYYGVGLGVYFSKVRGEVSEENTKKVVSDTKTHFGIPLLVGVDFGSNFFGELKYNLVFSENNPAPKLDVRVGGFNVMFGYKF